MMAHMTQTQTPAPEGPDPDLPADPDRPDPDRVRTAPPTNVRTPGRPDADRPDSGPGPDSRPGPGPDGTPTRTRTQTGRATRTKIYIKPDRPGPGNTQTQTRTRTQTRTNAARNWLGRGGYITALTIIVAIVAAIGQKLYAIDEKFVGQIGIFGFDATPWFAPFVFDVAVAALLHGGLNAAKDRFSPWPWWAGATVVAALSVWTNTQHVGAQITASASAGLFLIWGLHLYNRYQKIVREREVEDSAADKLVSTDVLFTVAKPLADRAWLIARTKPLAAGLAYRHRLGETQLTERDVAILAARIYIDIHADYLDVLLRPAAVAPADGKNAKAQAPVRWWQRARRRRALRLATMIAGDAVDMYLGLPVPERSSVIVPRIGYLTQEPTALLGAVTAPAQPAIASAAAPAAPALPAAATAEPIAAPAPRRRIAATAAESGQAAEAPVVILAPGQPAGNAGLRWAPLAKIPGLPEIDPTIMCQCHVEPAKRCGKTLVEHVERRGQYIRMIVSTVEKWDTRVEKIGKRDVKEACDIGGSGTQAEIAWVMEQLRQIAQEQRAERDAAASEATAVVASSTEVPEN